MNKEYEYKGYKFNVEVRLITTQERCINGRTWHTVIINDDNGFFFKDEIEESNLIEFLKTVVPTKIEEYVDKVLYKQPIEIELSVIGFK